MQNQLNIDLMWLAVHLLEKYLRALLLANGKPSNRGPEGEGKQKSFDHEVIRLFAAVKAIAGPLTPEALPRPDFCPAEHWQAGSTEKIVPLRFGWGSCCRRRS